MTHKRKTYIELLDKDSFVDRFHYLKLSGVVGESTFGSARYMNQAFYTSREWRRLRDAIILRDNGCDLGIPGREIQGPIIIHHINPINDADIEYNHPCLWDEDNLICVSKQTHDAIHYGSIDGLVLDLIERTPNDTCPWRQN